MCGGCRGGRRSTQDRVPDPQSHATPRTEGRPTYVLPLVLGAGENAWRVPAHLTDTQPLMHKGWCAGHKYGCVDTVLYGPSLTLPRLDGTWPLLVSWNNITAFVAFLLIRLCSLRQLTTLTTPPRMQDRNIAHKHCRGTRLRRSRLVAGQESRMLRASRLQREAQDCATAQEAMLSRESIDGNNLGEA